MINLEYSGSGTSTIAIWPEVNSQYATNISRSFSLELSQDYDRSTGSIDLSLLNTPDSLTPRLVFSLNRSDIPEYTGFYTYDLKEAILQDVKVWGQEDRQWYLADFKWSSSRDKTQDRLLDTDRAWISGSDTPAFTAYSSSAAETIYDSGSSYPATEYISADENGTYTTYHQ